MNPYTGLKTSLFDRTPQDSEIVLIDPARKYDVEMTICKNE